MPWRVFATSRTSETSSENTDDVVRLSCVVTSTEDEARGCALRLSREGAERVLVRPPSPGKLLEGPMLHNWLVAAQLRKLRR